MTCRETHFTENRALVEPSVRNLALVDAVRIRRTEALVAATLPAQASIRYRYSTKETSTSTSCIHRRGLVHSFEKARSVPSGYVP